MTMVERLRVDLLSATKQKDEVLKGILRVILGDTNTLEARTSKPVNDEQVYNIIRKLVEGNTETLSHMKEGKEKLLRENEIMAALLPKTMSRDDIEHILIIHVVNLKEAKSEGQAIGFAMKQIKQTGEPFVSDDIIQVVRKLRQ